MKIYLATDHAGFELKEKVKEFLQQEGYQVEDCGAYDFDQNDDYPDFISKAAEKVPQDPENNVGIIFGGSGQGEAMVANKFKNVRATVYYAPDLEIIKLSKEHNNANILSIGARFLSEQQVLEAIKLWLNTSFNNDERHVRRLNKISQLENQ